MEEIVAINWENIIKSPYLICVFLKTTAAIVKTGVKWHLALGKANKIKNDVHAPYNKLKTGLIFD